MNIEYVILSTIPTTKDVISVAKGISDFGMMAVAAAFFLVIGAALMWSCFAWFKALINNMIEQNTKGLEELRKETREQNSLLTDIAEGLRPETQLRIRNLTGFAFGESVDKVCRLIKRVRKENHIADLEKTKAKIRKSLQVIHNDRNSKFDVFTYKGNPISYYCEDAWIDAVENVVEAEIYHVDGANEERSRTNVEIVYDNIKTEFYQNMKE